MTSHKQIEQQLKRPDTFQDTILNALDFAKKNSSKVALMILPIIAVVLIGYGYYWWQQSQSGHRRAELAAIISLQSEEATSTGKQTEAIQKEIDSLRKPPAPTAEKAGEKKPELSAETLLKIGELEKKLTDVKPDHAASLAKFKEFYEKNKSSAEGWMAGLSWVSGQLASASAKASEVRPVLEDIVKASSAHKFYQIQARFMLASVLEELGEFDAALKEADILAGLADGEAKPMMLLLKGQLLFFKKDNASARTVLSEIVEKHGSTREAQTARSLLAEIGPA